MTLEPLLGASPIVQAHAAAAIVAFAIGGAILFGRKGDNRHKTLGRLWVGLMAVVALTSFFIFTIRLVGPFSPIHLLSVIVLVGLWGAVRHARAGHIVLHKRLMQQLYIYALLIAGFFTFMPGRIMHHVVFGTDNAGPGQWALFLTLYFMGTFVGYRLIAPRMGWRLPGFGRAG